MKIKIPTVDSNGKKEIREVEAQKITEHLYIHRDITETKQVYTGKTQVCSRWKITAMPCGFEVWHVGTKKLAVELANELAGFDLGRSAEEIQADKETMQEIWNIVSKKYGENRVRVYVRNNK